MDKVGGENLGGISSIRKVATASFIGTAIEWYDFFIYGTAAALVFGTLFFPEFSSTAGTLAAFATFGVGFVARPVGGAVFGHYGDKIGRKAMLVVSLTMMGLATALIGLLPTYASVGVLAPILLVVLRFAQGFAVGGEWGGAVLMAVEHAPRGRRGFYGSFPQMGVPAGVLLSNLVFLPLTSLPAEQFLSWGWRIPFLVSAVLVGVGLFIRLRIMESPAFARVRETRTQARVPIVDAFRAYPKQIALGAGSFLVIGAAFYVVIAFMLNYATTSVGVARSTVVAAILLASTVMLIVVPISGALSDRIGRKPLYLGGVAGVGLSSLPLFWLVDTGRFGFILLAFVACLTCLGIAYGPQAALYAEMFGTRVRYSGVSVSYQLGNVIGGAFAPLIATALLAATGSTFSISAYLAALAIVSFVCTLPIPDGYRDDDAIEEEQPEEQRLIVRGGDARVG